MLIEREEVGIVLFKFVLIEFYSLLFQETKRFKVEGPHFGNVCYLGNPYSLLYSIIGSFYGILFTKTTKMLIYIRHGLPTITHKNPNKNICSHFHSV